MVIKTLVAIVFIVIIILSAFVILNVNNEEIKNNFTNDSEKFVGMWRVINSQEIPPEDQNPDTTGESTSDENYQTYEFLSDGYFNHIETDNNYSGTWEINNSILQLNESDQYGSLQFSYEYAFSDDSNRVTLNIVEDPESTLELQKITTT